MSLPKLPKSRARLFKDLEDKPHLDVDPENDDAPLSDQSEADSDEEKFTGREHYQAVGRSTLRHGEPVSLGPQYAGASVSRNRAVDNVDAFEDLASDTDEESQQDYNLEADSDEDMEESATSGTDDALSLLDDEDDSDDSQDDFPNAGMENVEQQGSRESGPDRAELRRLMINSQKSVVNSLAQANKADAEKGKAVKQQRAAFDSLLKCRIRMQGGLVAINSLSGLSDGLDTDLQAATSKVQAAEEAALKLWNSLEELRLNLEHEHSGKKRKTPDPVQESDSEALWQRMKAHETYSLPKRREALQQWSTRAQASAMTPASRKMNGTSRDDAIVDNIQSQLLESERLIKRTQVPRSCAPEQAKAGITETAEIYDDADFYGILLKELLEQRNSDNASSYYMNAATQQLKDTRNARPKKQVDTKASKGRKMRFTVHEKLQNFMAPESRTTWPDRQTDELFGSLLGKRLSPSEDVEVLSDDSDAALEGGLRLFQSAI